VLIGGIYSVFTPEPDSYFGFAERGYVVR